LGADSTWRAMALVLTLGVLAAMLPRWWEDMRDRRSPMPLALPLTLCVNSVVSPYMLGYEHVLLLMPALVFLAAAGPAGLAASDEPELERSRKSWRLAIYMWMAVLPFLVVAVQAVLDGKEYPAIAQSLPMLALCWLFRLQWKRNNEENKTAPFPGGGGLNTL